VIPKPQMQTSIGESRDTVRRRPDGIRVIDSVEDASNEKFLARRDSYPTRMAVLRTLVEGSLTLNAHVGHDSSILLDSELN
jgi:hypothetical protein